MTGSGRFGKYGDLKRKEQMRATRVLRAGLSGMSFVMAGATKENRLEKRRKKKQRPV